MDGWIKDSVLMEMTKWMTDEKIVKNLYLWDGQKGLWATIGRIQKIKWKTNTS